MYIHDEEEGGSVLNHQPLDQFDGNKSVEICTSYIHTPNNNTVIKSNKISLKNLNDMSTLDLELSRINGRVS